MKWEYLVKNVDNVHDVKLGLEFGLNYYGGEEWEVVTVRENDVIFKRPIDNADNEFETMVQSKVLDIMRKNL